MPVLPKAHLSCEIFRDFVFVIYLGVEKKTDSLRSVLIVSCFAMLSAVPFPRISKCRRIHCSNVTASCCCQGLSALLVCM